SLFVGVRHGAGSRDVTPLSPLLREGHDAADSAIGSAGGSAAGTDAPSLRLGSKKQMGEQGDRLAALPVAQRHQGRRQELEVSWFVQSCGAGRGARMDQRTMGQIGLSYREALSTPEK